MRNLFPATIGLIAAMAFGAAAANAEPASLSTCTKAQSEVSAALSKDTGSVNNDQALKESHYGRDFCNTGLYKQGMVHYAEAMKLLGIS